MTTQKTNETNKTINLYNLLDADERQIVNALAIKKGIDKKITTQDVIAMFVAKKQKLNISCSDDEMEKSLRIFTAILDSVECGVKTEMEKAE